jgi:hypothetical protein
MEANPEKEAIVHWVAGEEPFRWTWGAYIDASANSDQMTLRSWSHPNVEGDRKLAELIAGYLDEQNAAVSRSTVKE